MIRAGVGAAAGALRGVLLDSPLSRAGSG
ncbi:Fe-S oxidoreductase, partial [Clavibacter nebraskensis]